MENNNVAYFPQYEVTYTYFPAALHLQHITAPVLTADNLLDEAVVECELWFLNYGTRARRYVRT
jgi:hypothetical protein